MKPELTSPGVERRPGQQRAVVVVADEVGGRGGPRAAGRFVESPNLDLVLGVPDVQQENVVHQHGVGRNHAACRRDVTRIGRNQSKPDDVSPPPPTRVSSVCTCSDTPVGQVRGDRDPPLFVDTHALEAAVHPRDESAQAHLADEGFAAVMTGHEERGGGGVQEEDGATEKCYRKSGSISISSIIK